MIKASQYIFLHPNFRGSSFISELVSPPVTLYFSSLSKHYRQRLSMASRPSDPRVCFAEQMKKRSASKSLSAFLIVNRFIHLFAHRKPS